MRVTYLGKHLLVVVAEVLLVKFVVGGVQILHHELRIVHLLLRHLQLVSLVFLQKLLVPLNEFFEIVHDFLEPDFTHLNH